MKLKDAIDDKAGHIGRFVLIEDGPDMQRRFPFAAPVPAEEVDFFVRRLISGATDRPLLLLPPSGA
jgi:hypothetical protein